MKNDRVSNTAKRLRQLMDERGLRQVDIVNLCQPYCRIHHIIINKADISIWLKGTVEPRATKLYILCLALNVSEPWMMGFDVPMERQTLPDRHPIDYVVKDGDNEILVEIADMNDQEKQLLRDYIALLKRSKK